MELDPQEMKMGYRWFFIAGTVAIALSFTLYRIDETLSASTYEKDKGRMMNTLRTTQHSLPSRVTDPRQNQEAQFQLKAVTNGELAELYPSEESSSHHTLGHHESGDVAPSALHTH